MFPLWSSQHHLWWNSLESSSLSCKIHLAAAVVGHHFPWRWAFWNRFPCMLSWISNDLFLTFMKLIVNVASLKAKRAELTCEFCWRCSSAAMTWGKNTCRACSMFIFSMFDGCTCSFVRFLASFVVISLWCSYNFCTNLPLMMPVLSLSSCSKNWLWTFLKTWQG